MTGVYQILRVPTPSLASMTKTANGRWSRAMNYLGNYAFRGRKRRKTVNRLPKYGLGHHNFLCFPASYAVVRGGFGAHRANMVSGTGTLEHCRLPRRMTLEDLTTSDGRGRRHRNGLLCGAFSASEDHGHPLFDAAGRLATSPRRLFITALAFRRRIPWIPSSRVGAELA